MLRKLFVALTALLCASFAIAQYLPPPAQSGLSGSAFYSVGKTSWLAGTTTSGTVLLSFSTNAAYGQIQVYNAGTTVAFVACGTLTITASAGTAGSATSDYPVAPGAVIVITPQAGANYCAGVYGTGSGAIYFTPGVGL